MTHNRIKKHVIVKAGDLVPHELNPRLHPESQRLALQEVLEEFGLARSLLAYELPDGRLKLIDGHLRAELNPDQEVTVEVLDVNDIEARALLLVIDPMAQLAEYNAETLAEVRSRAEPTSPAVRRMWEAIDAVGKSVEQAMDHKRRHQQDALQDQWLILVECADEDMQTSLLQRFQEEGLKCRALMG
jgi:hypothetical protein